MSMGSTATKTRTVGGRLSTNAAPRRLGATSRVAKEALDSGVAGRALVIEFHTHSVDLEHVARPRTADDGARHELDEAGRLGRLLRECLRRSTPLQVDRPGVQRPAVDPLRACPLASGLARSLRRARPPRHQSFVQTPFATSTHASVHGVATTVIPASLMGHGESEGAVGAREAFRPGTRLRRRGLRRCGPGTGLRGGETLRWRRRG